MRKHISIGRQNERTTLVLPIVGLDIGTISSGPGRRNSNSQPA